MEQQLLDALPKRPRSLTPDVAEEGRDFVMSVDFGSGSGRSLEV